MLMYERPHMMASAHTCIHTDVRIYACVCISDLHIHTQCSSPRTHIHTSHTHVHTHTHSTYVPVTTLVLSVFLHEHAHAGLAPERVVFCAFGIPKSDVPRQPHPELGLYVQDIIFRYLLLWPIIVYAAVLCGSGFGATRTPHSIFDPQTIFLHILSCIFVHGSLMAS